MTTSEQARADAMADAETLRQAVTFIDDAAYAGHNGSAAVRWLTRHPYSAYRYAIEAARAAFRAVPGLRG